jgi:hypothetical protein
MAYLWNQLNKKSMGQMLTTQADELFIASLTFKFVSELVVISS